METKLLEFIERLVKLLKTNDNISRISEDTAKVFNKLAEDLIEILVWRPGGIFKINSKENIDKFRIAVDLLLQGQSWEDLYNELISGGYGGLMLEEMDLYARRFVKLRPIFISNEPGDSEFDFYYNEAMKCWLHGLDNSSIVIITALLEKTLSSFLDDLNRNEISKLIKIVCEDNQYRGAKVRFYELIEITCYKKHITYENKQSFHEIRKIRNKIVHESYKITQEQSLSLLLKAKEYFEELYN